MANHYYGVDRGGQLPKDVTVDTSTTSKAIELVVLDGTSISKNELLKSLDAIRNKIAVGSAPA